MLVTKMEKELTPAQVDAVKELIADAPDMQTEVYRLSTGTAQVVFLGHSPYIRNIERGGRVYTPKRRSP